MQSEDEQFDDTFESLSPNKKTLDPEGRFSLRLTPSRIASAELRQKKMEEQNLFESLSRCSAETSSEGAFSYGNFQTAEPKTNLKKNYTPKEKADRLQKM